MKSDNVKKGMQQAPHRSLFNALGFTEEEMNKPMVGIVSSYNEIVPGHMNLDKIVNAVKLGVAEAGGVPVVFPAIAVCDGIAMGHIGMKYSLVTRDLIADSTECMALAHQFDALVMVPNCDKNVPGLLMAAARINVPTVFVSGGPMLAGHVQGKKRSLSSMFEAVGSYAAGTMTDGCVDIDTGALIFSTDIMKSLYSLIETDADYDRNVNERTRLSLYADFLYPLASDSTLEDFYREKPEGEFCPELTAARTRVWEVLRPYRMKLLRLAPAKFIHFGTTREILELMNGGVDEYHYLGWSRKVGSSIRSDVSGYNSVLSSRASVGKDCYLEVSYVHGNSRIGSHSVLSYIDVQDQVIPDNIVLHGLKQRNGKFIVRIFGVNDNPKENRLFGRDLDELEDTLGVRFWEENGQAHTLWSAALYQEADTIREATDAALELYEIVTGGKDFDRSLWTAASHKSLCAGFNEADPDAIIAWNKRMADLVTMDGIAKAIRDQVPAGSIRKLQSLTKIQKEWLRKRLRKADFGEKMRLHYYLGVILEDENEVQECFRIIQSEVLEATIKSLAYNEQARIVTDHHTVRLPLRVNWGGGWSDTPPYCNEKGGTVLNAAILLNGEKPVEVTLERIPEQKVVFDSRDMDVHGEFDTIEPLQATGDPYDPFALQKACLLACGIIPREGHTLGEILERLGSGFVMHSEVTNVPKGSGLGTSSILSAACVKAVFEFMGIAYTEEDLYAHVLAMEQIMSTGGGGQDQVGGITSGLKYITSMPGLQQRLQVAHIELSPQTKKELDERFVLIYTGQRRLARNLLRDVVGRYVGNEPDSLFALEEIQKTAVLIDCCTIILIPVSLKCGDTGVIYRLSFLSIRQRLFRWRLIRSRNTIVERTEEIPSATGSAKKAAFAPKKEGRTAALITKRDFLVTESASPVFGHSRAVSPSTKTYWKLSGMIISV